MKRVHTKVHIVYEIVLILLVIWIGYSTIDNRNVMIILSIMWILEGHVEKIITKIIYKISNYY